MKRIAAVCLAAVLLAACQESELTRPPESESVNLAISDEAHSGREGIWFFPPLVESPTGHPDFGSSPFNPDLMPFVRICELDSSDPPNCLPGQVGLDLPMELDLASEQYKVNWKTSDYSLTSGTHYRIQAYVGGTPNSPDPDASPGELFGFRDVLPLDNPNTASCGSEDYCQINNGSTVPIKIRIDADAFCPEGLSCQTKSTTFGEDERWEIEGNSYYALDVPTQPASNGTVTVTFQECEVDDVDGLIDLPTYGPCVETVMLTEEFDGVLDPDATATISFCDVDFSTFGLSPTQTDLLKLHAFHDDGSLEALREAAICPALTSLPSNPVLRLASRVRDRVGSWLGVRPLMATAAVAGTSRGGNSEGTIRTKFKFALPAKIEFVNPADETRISATGSSLTTQARVSDLYGNPVAGATVRWNTVSPPGEGAEVEGGVSSSAAACTTGSSDDVVCTTGNSGTVDVDWTLAGDPGVNVLTAGGRAIADPREAFNGPRDGTYTWGPVDPFVPIGFAEKTGDGIETPEAELAELIAENTRLAFTAIGCEPGFGTPNLSGQIEAGEWDCAIQHTIPVNLSGGSTVDATFYYMNDDTHFHLAVVVPGTGRVNSLRVEWDNNGSGNTDGRQLGDDIWEFDPDGGGADKFVDEKCSDSSQTSCGQDDDAFGGSMDTEVAFDNSGGETVYEMSHPLTDADTCTLDNGRRGCGAALGAAIDLDRSEGQPAGLWITLRLGKGAQGNTQWPGFLNYLPITIK